MGRRGKKGYDLFDQASPVTHVQLPRLDSRQPGPRSSFTEDGTTGLSLLIKGKDDNLTSSRGRSNLSSALSGIEPPEGHCSKNIRVKIPTFTNPIVTKEHLTLATTSASTFKHRKHQSFENTGLPRASAKKTFGPSQLAHHLTAKVIIPHRQIQRASPKKNINFRTGRTNKTKALVTNKLTTVAHPNPATGPSPLQGSRGRGKAPAKAVMKAARAHYREEKLANEKAQRHGASKMTTSLTTARADYTAASPAITTSKPKLKSSPKQWTDYASHTSAGHHTEASHKPHFRNPRGGGMSNHSLSPYNRSRGAHQRQYGGPIARHYYNDWTSWVEVRVNLYGLTPNIGTYELGCSFKDEGNIVVIEIFEDSSGSRSGKAKIVFR